MWNKLNKKVTESDEFIQLAQMEEDESFSSDIFNELTELKKALDDAEFKNMLSGKDDDKNCLLTIHSGAGGYLRHRIGRICYSECIYDGVNKITIK